MTAPLESAIVRIFATDNTIIGTGFLVTDRHILTCAHVVADALGISGEAEDKPAAPINLDFPLIAPGEIQAGQIVVWQPQVDLAGLTLASNPPVRAKPARLVTADDLWGHAFRAYGFPAGYDQGIWASGALRGRQAAGWIQIEDVKQTGYFVAPGFSGGPVWDEQLNSVAGMVVAADTQTEFKAAFMIPTNLLIESWPELAHHSLDVQELAYWQEQLAALEAAQQHASDPRRFEAKIDELKHTITTWAGRVETQRQRIAAGLTEQRQQLAAAAKQRRDQKRLAVVGRRPLGTVDYFKNRQREQETIGQLLAEPATRLVSVIGHGGMGKTALAGKVLRDLEQHRWPHTGEAIPLDGIIYLSTRTAGISLERLFLDCAKLLGGELEERLNAIWTNPKLATEDKISHLLEALKEGLYVILLDNLEDLLDDRGQLTDEDLQLFFDRSLTTAHGARLLVTSRLTLAFKREVMRFDRQVKLLEGLPTADGVALLRELDPNGDYGLQDAPEEQLAQAVELVHGVPRALEVMAGILANDPFASLDDVTGHFYEHEDVVQALVEENYKRLDGNARRVIEALAVFKRPVPPLAVDYLLEPFAPGMDMPGILRRLMRINIVSIDRATKTVSLHPIDQDYAYSQLPGEETNDVVYNRQTLERRAADYYAQLRTPEDTWQTIDDLRPQLAEFEHRVRAEDYDEACRILQPIDFDYLFKWGHNARLVALRKNLLGKLTDSTLQIANLTSLGLIHRTLGKIDQAVAYQEQALSIARKVGDERLECGLLADLGLNYRTMGEMERGIRYHEQGLRIARRSGQRQEEGRQLGNLGSAYFDLGQIEWAIEYWEQALTIARETDDRLREAFWLSGLGWGYIALGEVEKSINLCKQGLAIVRQLNNRWAESNHLGYLGDVYYRQGQVEQAIKYYGQAIDIAREIDAYSVQSQYLGELAKALLATGDVVAARQCGEESFSFNLPYSSYQPRLILSIILLHQDADKAGESFMDTVSDCQTLLTRTPNLYKVCYALATALVGQAVTNIGWVEQKRRGELLTPALTEYHRALEITAAPGVVQDALRDLELIRAAGVEGLEPVFELLEGELRKQ